MEQELTLAQCKSTFRIFQVGIPEPRSGKFSDWFGILESHVESDGRRRNGTKDNVSHHAIHQEKLLKVLSGAISNRFHCVKYFPSKLEKN